MPVGERSRQLRLVQEVPPSYLAVSKTSAYSMQVRDNLVKTDSTAGPFTVTLPPVVEAAGGTFMIKNVAGTALVTVIDKGDSLVVVNQTTVLLTSTAALLYYSDGERWYLLNSYA